MLISGPGQTRKERAFPRRTHGARDRPIRWDYITAGNTGPQGADSSWYGRREWSEGEQPGGSRRRGEGTRVKVL